MSDDYKSQESAGGQNYALLYRVKRKTSGGYDFLDGLTDVVVAAPAPANAAMILDVIEGTKPAFKEGGLVDIPWDQYDAGKSFWKALGKIAVPALGGSTVKAVALENGGSKFGGSSGEEIVVIAALHPDDLNTPTEIFHLAAFGGISETSGSFETKDGNGIKPTLGFLGKKAASDLVIPATAFPGIVTGAAATIPKDRCWWRDFLPLKP